MRLPLPCWAPSAPAAEAQPCYPTDAKGAPPPAGRPARSAALQLLARANNADCWRFFCWLAGYGRITQNNSVRRTPDSLHPDGCASRSIHLDTTCRFSCDADKQRAIRCLPWWLRSTPSSSSISSGKSMSTLPVVCKVLYHDTYCPVQVPFQLQARLPALNARPFRWLSLGQMPAAQQAGTALALRTCRHRPGSQPPPSRPSSGSRRESAESAICGTCTANSKFRNGSPLKKRWSSRPI